MRLEDLEPELQEAVRQYRHYGHEVSKYDHNVSKFGRDDDYEKLKEAVERRNFWFSRIKELIKGREKELGWTLIG